MAYLFLALYLCTKIDGEDGGGLGGPVGVMMVMMMSPLFLLPPEQILVTERNAAIILKKQEACGRKKRIDTCNEKIIIFLNVEFSDDAIR